MEFRLIYKGSLPADQGQGGRTIYKHRIRKEFHKQLRELWHQQPKLKSQSETQYVISATPPNQVSHPGPNVRQIYRADDLMPGSATHPRGKTWVEHIADNFSRLGGRFVPLIRMDSGLTCALDVLFLRRDAPGNIVKQGAGGGDIDNRLKVLFDGLKMPGRADDLGGLSIDSDEDPFFCLLEDDSLITRIAITSDRLLLPLEGDEKRNDVHMIVHVTVNDESGIFFGGNRLI
jgi:hypothetical protein